MPRILIVYQSKPDIVSGLSRGLKNRGVDVFLFLADKHHHFIDKYIFHVINKWAHNLRILKKNNYLFKGHRLNHWIYINRKLLEFYNKTKPDLIIFVHGIHYSDYTLSELNCSKIGWLVDPVINSERLWLFASKLDWYFSYSQAAINLLNQRGFKKTSYLSHAVDHNNFYLIPGQKKLIDISFVGKHSIHREKYILAAIDVTKNVTIYGSRWISRALCNPTLFKAFKGFQCYGVHLNELYNSSRIVLSITAKPLGTNGIESGINMRPYEVLATGALLFSDLSEEFDGELVHNHNLVFFRSVEQFKSHLTALLNHPTDIDRISRNGQIFIKNRFSYDAMAETFLEQYKKLTALT